MSSLASNQNAPQRFSRATEFDRTLAVRLWGLFLLVFFGCILGVGLYLHPSHKGFGQRELGLPPCGFLLATGYPCPTCGYTTAVSYVSHGQWLTALATQPAGAAFGFLALALFALGTLSVVKGRWYGPSPFWLGWHWQRICWVSLLIVLLGWGYRVLVVRGFFGHHG
ncbi:MAG: DUF2752 domain-containing protein [Phycisphaerales bacterium]|nr:DUF2752 domain-containing protein [Phycisphaerales bacterium]